MNAVHEESVLREDSSGHVVSVADDSQADGLRPVGYDRYALRRVAKKQLVCGPDGWWRAVPCRHDSLTAGDEAI